MRQYDASLKDKTFYTNRLYLSPVFRLAGTKADRVGLKFTSKSSEDYRALHEQAKEEVDRFASNMVSFLRRYHTKALSSYSSNDGLNTELGEFYSALLNHSESKIRLQPANLSQTLQRATIDFGEETVRISNPASTTYAAVLTMVAPYTCEQIDAEVHAPLLTADFEFVLSQSFTTMPRDAAERMLKAQENRIKSTAQNEIQQQDINDALQNLQANKFKMLSHEWILVVYGDTMKQLNKSVADAVDLMGGKNVQIARENGGSLIATYFSIFPGAFRHGRIRAMPISSRNMAKFYPLHNYPNGNREGSQWGKPLMVLTTESKNPYFLNYHVSRDRMAEQGIQLDAYEEQDEDDVNNRRAQRKEVGNYIIIGDTGGGKTTLKAAMRAALKRKATKGNQSVKVFALDKDSGEEILMRAMGGQYFILEPGMPSGINPFQWGDTEEIRELIFQLSKWAAEYETPYQLRAGDLIDLKKAIGYTFDLPINERRFGNILSYLPSHESDASLHQSLGRWRRDDDDPRSTPYGWVLDSPVDRLNLAGADTFGFDVTSILKLDYAKTPLMRLITEKILRAAAGSPHVIDIAEAWATLKDPLMGNFIEDKSRTIRKQNGIIGLDTQNAEDATASQFGSQFMNQFPTLFILPNPRARAATYIDGLNLTPKELSLVQGGRTDQGDVLIKKGTESIMAKLNLTGMNNMLSVLSSSTDNVMICREVIKEYGSDPKVWLPRFYERRI